MRSGQAGGGGMRRHKLWVGSEGDTVDLLMGQMRWREPRVLLLLSPPFRLEH